MKYEIDFSLLPDLSSSKVRYALDENLISNLEKFPLLTERAVNATRFCWFVTSLGEYHSLGEPELTWLRQGFLRASLTEFVSMKEILKQELKSLGIQNNISVINRSKNPLLHIVHELRNFEMHLHSVTLNSNNISTIFNRKTEPNIWEEVNLTIWTIDDLNLADFTNLCNAKKYNKVDLVRMIEWFNYAQNQWGIHYLVFLSVNFFCNEVVSIYLTN
jgi:hypothetical protein